VPTARRLVTPLMTSPDCMTLCSCRHNLQSCRFGNSDQLSVWTLYCRRLCSKSAQSA